MCTAFTTIYIKHHSGKYNNRMRERVHDIDSNSRYIGLMLPNQMVGRSNVAQSNGR